jgi:hypothetical protein
MTLELAAKVDFRGERLLVQIGKITAGYRDHAMSQIMAKRWEYFELTGRNLADTNREAMASFNERWNDLDRQIVIVPGKDVLRDLRVKSRNIT